MIPEVAIGLVVAQVRLTLHVLAFKAMVQDPAEDDNVPSIILTMTVQLEVMAPVV